MKYLVHENAKREQAEFDLQSFSCDVCYSDKPVCTCLICAVFLTICFTGQGVREAQ